MRYLLFLTDRPYLDEQGNECDLASHLRELRRWGGTPDFAVAFHTLSEAVQEALRYSKTITIVDEYADHAVLETVKYDPANIKFG